MFPIEINRRHMTGEPRNPAQASPREFPSERLPVVLLDDDRDVVAPTPSDPLTIIDLDVEIVRAAIDDDNRRAVAAAAYRKSARLLLRYGKLLSNAALCLEFEAAAVVLNARAAAVSEGVGDSNEEF